MFHIGGIIAKSGRLEMAILPSLACDKDGLSGAKPIMGRIDGPTRILRLLRTMST
jgi:hypothetical protein